MSCPDPPSAYPHSPKCLEEETFSEVLFVRLVHLGCSMHLPQPSLRQGGVCPWRDKNTHQWGATAPTYATS